MKKTFLTTLLSCMIAGALFTTPMQAGQVVTDDIKGWAREAVENEKAEANPIDRRPSSGGSPICFTRKPKTKATRIITASIFFLFLIESKLKLKKNKK